VTTLLFLSHGANEAIRHQALATARSLPVGVLLPVVGDPDTHPQLLDFVAGLDPLVHAKRRTAGVPAGGLFRSGDS
jgi:hypothetical protein